MHPDIREQAPGICPLCNMKLAAQAAPTSTGAGTGSPRVHLSTERQQLIGVRTTEIGEQPLARSVVAAGTLASDETRVVEVESDVSGVVVEVLGNPVGQKVRKGEPLLVVETEDGARVTLAAKATGHISWRLATVGAKVTPRSKVCTIYDHAGVWVWVEVVERDLPFVKVGQTAKMRVPAYPGRTFEGWVSQVSPLLEPDTHTMKVRIDFVNTGFLLKPGMSAVVDVAAELGTKLAVPEAAVLRTGVEDVVFVAAGDGAFDVRTVVLGQLVGDVYEVVSGLEAGEKVVTTANFLIDAESRLQGVRAAWGGAPR